MLTEFIALVRDAFEAAAREGEAPVMSQSEIHPRVRLKTVGSI
jgi:hypothetical protein